MSAILIETPLREEMQIDVPYALAMDKVYKDVLKMNQSKNYEEITIHYGVKSKTEYNHNERVFRRKQEIYHHKFNQ